MQWHELSELDEEIDFFRANCADSADLATFMVEFEAWKKLEPGQPAIDFVGEDLEGKTASQKS